MRRAAVTTRRRPRQREQPVDSRHCGNLRRGARDRPPRLPRSRRPERGRDDARRGSAPVLRHRAEHGRPGRCRAIASVSSARWRSLATRLRITPASGTCGSCRAKPATRAATEAPCPRAVDDEHDRPAGQPASSAVEPASPSGPVPSKRPMTPSHTTMSARRSRSATRPSQRRRPHRPGVEIEAGAAARRGVKGRVDVVGAALRRRDARARVRADGAAAPP